ncbi:hypothetical protein BN2475_50070 [Paraburkholderia ribeironis]|uniref:Uncharacterized protein n=1 Tax=Paraburkholderia ribeironis TaxID=1247936 RepID=A0A1N7RK74_9BURK|nr:hypothetical protein BN2475_50070 [Paraburkholderia ribeironis]
MDCAIGSDAAAGFAASEADGVDASGSTAADEVAGRGAAWLSVTPGDEDVVVGAESSAPQPLSANVASAIDAMLATHLSLLMLHPVLVKAGAVSIPFKK